MALQQQEPQQLVFDVGQVARLAPEHLDPQRGDGGQLAQYVTHCDQRIVAYLIEIQRLPVLDDDGPFGCGHAFTRVAESQQCHLHQVVERGADGDDHVTVRFDLRSPCPACLVQRPGLVQGTYRLHDAMHRYRFAWNNTEIVNHLLLSPDCGINGVSGIKNTSYRSLANDPSSQLKNVMER